MLFTAKSKRVLVTLAALAAFSAEVRAQPVNNDYYNPQNKPLLRTVEQYHLHPGREYLRQRHYEQAFNDFLFILRYFPNHPQALLSIVQVCAEWKKPKCYLDPFFENAIARKTDAPDTYIAQGIWLHRSKRFADAIASYQKAVAIDPRSFNAHYNLGLAYFATRQYALANEHAQQAYAFGAPLPGLRDQLTKGGHWKPLPPASEASTEQNATPPNREGDAQTSSSAAKPR